MRDPTAVHCEQEWRRTITAKRAALDAERAMHDNQGRSPASIEASGRAFAVAALGIVAIVVVLLAMWVMA